MKLVQRNLKSIVDRVISLISLIILAIPFLIIAIAIKLDSTGPVFFRQERVGRHSRLFKIWKFRTMVEGAVNQGLGVTVAQDDPRITRVGRFLRNFGLDELPQLINVLKGEMSLVGPRPTLPYQAELYNEFQKRRLEVKPGLTGWALVNGRNRLTWEERIKLDVWYVDHAIGDNATRKRLQETVKALGYELATAVHPSARLGRDVSVGPGTVIMAQVAINSGTVIGEGVIVNTGATIDHDCRIGDFAHISPGVHLAGNVTVGALTHMGIGACAIPGVHIGERTLIRAGAAVTDDIPDNATAVGVPAKVIKKS